jgi:hypothetical protein
MELREINLLHEKKLNNLENERSKLIEKIKYLEVKLLDKSVVPTSNIASASKSVFVKPEVAEPQNACENANIKLVVYVMKHSKSKSLPTCHHCGVIGHIKPHCPQIRTQKPRIKKSQRKVNLALNFPSLIMLLSQSGNTYNGFLLHVAIVARMATPRPNTSS